MLTENKFIKYLLYAIGEIILVVIGILIALQVNNWNEKRKSKIQEQIILKNLVQDLKADSLSFSKNIKTLTEHGKKSLNEAYAHLQLWNSGLLGLVSWLESVNNESRNLLIFIQKEYHIN